MSLKTPVPSLYVISHLAHVEGLVGYNIPSLFLAYKELKARLEESIVKFT